MVTVVVSDRFLGSEELESDELRMWILVLRNNDFINENRGERTLQMWICSHLIRKFFFGDPPRYHFRRILAEERASEGESDIGDIMLPSQTHEKRVDVWVEIKNHFGKNSLTAAEQTKLERDFEKCQKSVNNGGSAGVVLVTIDHVADAEQYTGPLNEKYPDVTVVIIGDR